MILENMIKHKLKLVKNLASNGKYRTVKLFLAIISCTMFFLKCIDSIDREITNSELSSVGTGFQIFHNLEGGERFAIVEPPLSGIISYSILNSIYQLDNIGAIPSGNYFDIVSFIFALETPKVIGSQILSSVGEKNFKVTRYVNILLLLVVVYIVSRGNIFILIIAPLLLMPYSGALMTSTSETLSTLFLLLTLNLVKSTSDCPSYIKFTLLGLVIGLLMATYGSNGMILAGIAILSQVIFIDIKEKRFNKGFKREWVIGTLITFGVSLITLWICYGMDLACYCQLESLLSLKPSSSIRIVPFFDIMKQTIFEIIFSTKEHKYSLFENVSNFFNGYNLLVILLIILVSVRKLSHYGIFSLISLIAVLIYNDSNVELINSFFNIISVILAIALTLQIRDYFNGVS
jgi:hypothetical protein